MYFAHINFQALIMANYGRIIARFYLKAWPADAICAQQKKKYTGGFKMSHPAIYANNIKTWIEKELRVKQSPYSLSLFVGVLAWWKLGQTGKSLMCWKEYKAR